MMSSSLAVLQDQGWLRWFQFCQFWRWLMRKIIRLSHSTTNGTGVWLGGSLGNGVHSASYTGLLYVFDKWQWDSQCYPKRPSAWVDLNRGLTGVADVTFPHSSSTQNVVICWMDNIDVFVELKKKEGYCLQRVIWTLEILNWD